MTPYELTGPLTTERLRLRRFTADDVDAVHAYQRLPEVTRYQLFDPRTREQVAERLAEHARRSRLAEPDDYLQLAVERLADARVIGDLYLGIRSTADATATIGWSFHPDAHGRGYAAESARALLGLLFERIGVHRVVAELDPRNLPSIRLCRRLGMREEAHFVQDLWFKGAWADTGVFALLESEWPSAGSPVDG